MDVTTEETLENLCLAVDIRIAPAVHAHLIPWDACHSLHEEIPTQRKPSQKSLASHIYYALPATNTIAYHTMHCLQHILMAGTSTKQMTVESTVENMCLAPTRPPVAATTSFRRGGGVKRTISPLFGLAPNLDDTFSTRRRSGVHSAPTLALNVRKLQC